MPRHPHRGRLAPAQIWRRSAPARKPLPETQEDKAAALHLTQKVEPVVEEPEPQLPEIITTGANSKVSWWGSRGRGGGGGGSRRRRRRRAVAG
jgi:hypothetical protein